MRLDNNGSTNPPSDSVQRIAAKDTLSQQSISSTPVDNHRSHSSVRRPPPSPVTSPEPKSNAKFASASSPPSSSSNPNPNRLGAYKRARTVSPIIDENSSDAEPEQRSTYSRSNSDFGELDNNDPSTSASLYPPNSQLLPTPLRESFSSADIASPYRKNHNMSTAPDQNIEALMTEKSLSLDDQASRLAQMPQQPTTGDQEGLPSYQEALGQLVVDSDVPLSRPSGKEQLNLVRPMKNRALAVGDTWYLISRAWYRRWSASCSGQLDADTDGEGDLVGSIDNKPLLHEDSTPAQPRLKAPITEGVDYEMVPQEGWDLLVGCYGVDGPIFARKVIAGLKEGQESVEFYPPVVSLLKLVEDESVQGSGVPSFTLSISSPLSELKAKAKAAFDLGTIADTDVRLWHLPEPTDEELRSGLIFLGRTDTEGVERIDAGEDKVDTYSPHITLQSVGIEEMEVVLAVETRTSTGRWITDPPVTDSQSTGIFAQKSDFFSNLQQSSAASSAASSEPQGRVTRSQTAMDRTVGRSVGLRGLNNLGNTCFMNSALQCMSNTFELQQYFSSGVYKDELNPDNPLGMGGAIAEAFGSLIGNLWNGQGGSFWPREFKFALSRFAPQFSGYAQHDSQELLAFLLDGLHEDLNRILKKPYIEAPDWEGGNERDLVAFAKRQWDIYKARNDSVIVDLFQGQYKSTLVCPECSKVSIKFDPFMYLTLPIPNKKTWRASVYFVPLEADKPIQKFDVQLPAGSTVSKLRQKVATQFSVETRRLICGEVWHSRIYRWIDDYEPVIDIKSSDYIYFWEVPTVPTKHQKQRGYRYHRTVEDAEADLTITEEEQATLPVFTSFATNVAGTSSTQAFVSRRNRSEVTGIPFFVSIPKSQINDAEAIRKAVTQAFMRFVDDRDKFIAAIEPRTASDGPSNGATHGQLGDWEMVDEASRSESAVEMVTLAEAPSEDVVTEIREDGEAVVIQDSSARAGEPEADAGIIVPKPEDEDNAQEHHTSMPVLSIRFRVAENGQPLPLGAQDGSDHLSEDLFERQARLAKRLGDPSLAPPDGMSEDEQDASTGKEREVPKTVPLVYTGGALLVSWSPRIKEENVFVEAQNGQVWGSVNTVVDEEIRSQDNTGSSKPKSLSIEDCMDEFTKEEQLGEDDPWYCPSCKEFRQATKKFDLWKVPDILVVHLKRFSSGRHSRDKLNSYVDFPLEGLDLTERVEGTKAVRRVQEEAEANGEELSESMLGSGILRPLEDNDDAVATDRPIYDLYAVDNHFGGLGGGHYTAFAKNASDGKWYEFDDSSVRPVANPETVKSSSAYLLFYRRRTTRPIGGKSRQKFQEAVKTKQIRSDGNGAEDAAVAGPSHLSTVTSAVDADADADADADDSSDDSPGWSSTLRGKLDIGDNEDLWSSTGNSPALSSRPLSPVSDEDPQPMLTRDLDDSD